MLLLLVSFLSGALTVLAPCILPVLPIIIGGSVQGGQKRNPYLITGSLAVAIVLFTLILKFSTAFINIPQSVWTSISGGILIIFGLISLFPRVWDAVNVKLGLGNRSEEILASSRDKKTRLGDILIGLSLGPVFSSCSPTYFLILATVLPRSLATGIAYLIAYALGLALVLLLISLLGQRFIQKARWAANPNGWFKRGLGVLFILVGIFILTGADKKVQTLLLEKDYFNITNIEQSILKSADQGSANSLTVTSTPSTGTTADTMFPQYREIADPTGFVNASSIKIGDLVGKKVILVDFMTYSCINCIRTFPYLNAWYDKYRDQGLEIVGIHTPEFAFEKNLDNVRSAIQRYGIKFPIVLDNNYGTWNAYGNQYWPRKYLIDINGKVVYDHIGEGGYDETEEKIQELLRDKLTYDHQAVNAIPSGTVQVQAQAAPTGGQSPETYFGSDRNSYLANGAAGRAGTQTLTRPTTLKPDALYLSGTWKFEGEHAATVSSKAQVFYNYTAQNVYFVSSANKPVRVKVLLDGKPLTREQAGSDIRFEGDQSYATIQEERLYNLVKDTPSGEHTLELEAQSAGLKAYTFTFG
jgi:cytochrome c biogenesis protein CcdA/thiol-disulfide isomerase/thioredoxin